jgi:hypothetical protein
VRRRIHTRRRIHACSCASRPPHHAALPVEHACILLLVCILLLTMQHFLFLLPLTPSRPWPCHMRRRTHARHMRPWPCPCAYMRWRIHAGPCTCGYMSTCMPMRPWPSASAPSPSAAPAPPPLTLPSLLFWSDEDQCPGRHMRRRIHTRRRIHAC